MVTRPLQKLSPSLLVSLRQYRTDQAYLRAVPPAAVFSNKLLTSIVSSRPSTLTALQKLHGIGPTRCQNYGRDIVRFVNLDSKKKGKRIKDKKTSAARKPDAKGRRTAKEIRGATPSKAIKAKSIDSKPKVGPKIVTSRFFPGQFIAPIAPIIPIIPIIPITTTTIIPRRLPMPKTSVYVLELEDGRVYVGSSRDVPRRISQHAAGSGSAYTKIYRPTGVQLPRLGNVEGDGDAAERDETLRYMMLRGVPFVRGWKFARVDMPPDEFDEAESNIRELFDLCRKCGYKGHFCTYCRATFDRLGRPVG
jgi:predicted GIY-YIG superfamily endonuclease